MNKVLANPMRLRTCIMKMIGREMGSIFEDLFLRKSDFLDKIFFFFFFFVDKTGKVILDACYMLNR